MSVRKATTTRALFLELVLDLVIFALCAVICLQVFASAHLESSRSAALSQLSVEAQEIAELFKSGAGDMASLALRPSAQQDEGAVVWRYNQDLSPATDEGAYFVLTCTIDDSQPVKRAHITLTEDSAQLFAYDVARYRPADGGDS